MDYCDHHDNNFKRDLQCSFVRFYRINGLNIFKIVAHSGVSTSGFAFKHPGRVGDSPLPGSGLYADDEVLVIYDIILKIIDRYATWEKGCLLFAYICVPINNHPL